MEAKDLVKDVAKTVSRPIELMKPVRTRTINRHKELQELSRAKSEKVMYGQRFQWRTTPPKIHISKLEMYLKDGKGIINYETYKLVDSKNQVQTSRDGKDIQQKERIINTVFGQKFLNERAEPVVEFLVTETIAAGKLIKTDKIKVGDTLE